MCTRPRWDLAVNGPWATFIDPGHAGRGPAGSEKFLLIPPFPGRLFRPSGSGENLKPLEIQPRGAQPSQMPHVALG